MPDAEQIRATITRYAEVFSANDLDGYLDLFADDATLEDPVGGGVHEGKAAIAEFMTATRAASPDIELRITGPVRVAGDEAAFPGEARPLFDGQRMAIPIVDTVRFDADGKITQLRAFWDVADLAPTGD